MKIAVIADDLTGANATGVLLSKQGFSTVTIVQGLPAPSVDYDAVCIDTDSRYVSPAEAGRRVADAATSMRDAGAELFCKRIDSTVRGNIGTEIDAVLNTLGEQAAAVVLPSFPQSGRITVGGYLLVHGVPVQETDVARDPVSPLRQSYVPQIIAEQSSERVAHIGMDTVLNGREAVAAQLYETVQESVRIIVVDAVTEEQVETVAAAMASLEQLFVAVDPGPLSAAFARAKFGQLERGPKVLVTVGSVTSLTERQLDHLIRQWDVKPVYVRPDKLAGEAEERDGEIERAVAEGLKRVQADTVVLVTTCQPGNALLDLPALARQEGTSEDSLAKRITDGLAGISRRIVERSNGAIGGCFSSGGDVTASLCAVAGAKGIELADEVLPLAAYGHFIEGYLDDMPVVTKGGLVGDETAISTCVRFLLTKLSKS